MLTVFIQKRKRCCLRKIKMFASYLSRVSYDLAETQKLKRTVDSFYCFGIPCARDTFTYFTRFLYLHQVVVAFRLHGGKTPSANRLNCRFPDIQFPRSKMSTYSGVYRASLVVADGCQQLLPHKPGHYNKLLFTFVLHENYKLSAILLRR